MVETVDALASAHAESKRRGTNFGFYGCSVTAVYNISATATADNKVGLSATGPTPPLVPIGYSGSISSDVNTSGTRGNTVTVVLETPYCMQGTGAKPPGGPPPMVIQKRLDKRTLDDLKDQIKKELQEEKDK